MPRALQILVLRLGCSLYPTCGQDLHAVLAVGSRMLGRQQGQPFSGDTPCSKAVPAAQHSPAPLQAPPEVSWPRELCRVASVRSKWTKEQI